MALPAILVPMIAYNAAPLYTQGNTMTVGDDTLQCAVFGGCLDHLVFAHGADPLRLRQGDYQEPVGSDAVLPL